MKEGPDVRLVRGGGGGQGSDLLFMSMPIVELRLKQSRFYVSEVLA